MDKKEYLIKILTHLEPVWDLAKWLKILVENWNFDNDMLETLINSVQQAVNNAKNSLEKQKLQKWLDAMKRMRELEEESKIRDEKDLEDLDRILENI